MYNRVFIKFISIISGTAAIYFELYSLKMLFMILAITADTLCAPPYMQSSCRFHIVVTSIFIYAYQVLLYLIEYGDKLEEEGVEVWTKKKRRHLDSE